MKAYSILRANFTLLAMALSFACMAQQPVPFQNPSFEDQPDFGKPPVGWFYCGNFGETPPDIHPGGFYGVVTPPKDGQTYVGMVARDNGTEEQLGQRLAAPLVRGQCYAFRIFAARSEQYASFSRITGQPAPFTLPLKLTVLGAHRHCEPVAVLAYSKTILETEWQQLDFLLQPKAAFEYLILAATSANGEFYNGNLLLDAASPLVPCDCNSGMPVLERFDLPQPGASTVWKDWLAELNTDLEDGVLVQHLFETADGVVHYQNRYLLGLARFVQYSAGAKLRITFNPEHCPAQFEEKLKQEIERCGLIKKRYVFKESKTGNGCAMIAGIY
ncbi:MAG: hypothetical protein SH848_07060 [Saprospiraceae bacterium]|nr:hypothetical protein [Saprospiraceae bacterium]MDZ4703670.1 hypothetical protein [Saprospiraceae bacterium]